MEVVYMAKKFWVLFAVIVVSLNYGCAGKPPLVADLTTGMEKVTPAPLFSAPTATVTDTVMEMVYVKGGCYEMGNVFDYAGFEENPGEKPVHEVCVDDFYMGKYEVTQGQWELIMGSNTYLESLTCRDKKCPVGNVSWNEVQDFISRLNSRSGGNKYRLPTEAEWEYAARSGGKRELYSGGNDVDRVAWYDGNSDYRLHPVGAKAPNGLGLHDMSGNIWEMTSDWYGSDYYSKSPRNNPTGPDKPEGPEIDRVVRGGCATGGSPNQRTTKRSHAFEHTTPTDRSRSLGFRILRTP